MIVVAIPVNNEAGQIADLLESLALQENCPNFETLLFLNNCTDDTEAIVSALTPCLPYAVRVWNRELQASLANAGMARRLAMKGAAIIAGANGTLLTTDADARPLPNWIAANLDALATGVDAVAGRAIIDPADEAKLPRRLVEDEARVQLLTTLLDRIEHVIDPCVLDPWPRHTQQSGASIGVTVSAFMSVGGIPAMASGEDRAFFKALRFHDQRIRHAPESTTIVSGRLFGRAVGGMADTMRRRLSQPDNWLDDTVEDVDCRLQRARLRNAFRTEWKTKTSALVQTWCHKLDIGPKVMGMALHATRFGEAWEIIERCSPVLGRARVPYHACEAQIERALTILQTIDGGSVSTAIEYSIS